MSILSADVNIPHHRGGDEFSVALSRLSIKVVIWDLDDTLWKGTLAEGDTPTLYESRAELIKKLNRRGIVNSICSKNDFNKAKAQLIQFELWEQFVFPKIAFRSKGEMIRSLLDEMHLQAKHALFIDDNIGNLNEAKFYNSELNVLAAEDCEAIPVDEWGKDDAQLTRLNQYRTLEEKTESRKASASNEEFLKSSGIKIEFLDYSETLFERLYELTERTNQLNFTKNRMNRDELRRLVKNPEIKTQLIRAEDNFGDYGIIGFYSLRANELIHFVFSCRIMSMGIEQFVYEHLNYPALTIVGETAATVEKRDWKIDYIAVIDNEFKSYSDESIENVLSEETRINIFALGACDLYHVMGYFAMPNQDLNYECNVFLGRWQGVNTGTEYIRSMLEMNDSEKAFCRAHFRNYMRYNAFASKIFDPKWDYVILSFLEDMRNRIFEFKGNPNMRAIEPYDPKTGTAGTYAYNIGGTEIPSKEREQQWIDENFNVRFISQQRFADNLCLIANRIPAQTKLVLITGPDIGAQFNYPPELVEQIAKINAVIRAFGRQFPNKFAVVEINEFVRSKADVTDGPFHLQAITAYKLFVRIIETIVRQFPNSKPPMLRRVLNGRRIVLLGNGNFEMINAFFNLSLGNCRPHEFAYPIPIDGSNFPLSDWKQYINRRDEYFAVIADNMNYSKLRQLLIESGYRPLRDFVQWKPLPYRLL